MLGFIERRDLISSGVVDWVFQSKISAKEPTHKASTMGKAFALHVPDPGLIPVPDMVLWTPTGIIPKHRVRSRP